MRSIVTFFVRNHLFGDLLTLAVIGVGFASLFLIRREVFPNVQFDIVNVVTVYPGASPEEVEKLITNPIEQDLQEVDGIKKVLSTSEESRSDIGVFVDPDRANLDKVKSDIQDIIDRKTDLPAGAEKPVVVSLETKQAPVIDVTVSGDLPELEMRKVLKTLEAEIETIPGVARAVPNPLRKVEIRVEADLQKLNQYRLALDDIVLALKGQNVTIPGGTIEVRGENDKGVESIVRTIGEFKTLEDVLKTPIRANDLGRTITVGDVAKAHYELDRPSVLVTTNGKRSTNLTVLLKENTDAIDVVDRVRSRITAFAKTLDPRVKIGFINDMSEFIRRRLSVLTGNLTIGLTLVLLMLPMMIPFRFSLLIALGEPFAFLGTILLLYMFGYSINLISMLGLIIVSGILVDDSIVVTENAVRIVEEGKDPSVAAIDGTLQIMPPVTASVLSTTTAFLPMLFMSGIFGKFVREIPIAVITALAVSLLETFFILPAHVAHWIKPQKKGEKPKEEGNFLSRSLTRFTNATMSLWEKRAVPVYLYWLKISLKRRYWVAAGGLAVFFGTIGLATGVMKFILFPPEGIEIFFIQTQAETGIPLDRHMKLLKPIEEKVSALGPKELQDYVSVVGVIQQDPNDPNTRRGSEYGQVIVYLQPEQTRDRTAPEIIDSLRKELPQVPGLKKIAFERVSSGPPTGRPISLGLRAKTYEEIIPAASEIKKRLAEIPGVRDIADSYVMGKEEYRVVVNPSEMAASQLSVAGIGTTVRAAFEGQIATSIQQLDDEIKVRVSLPRQDRSDRETLENLLIPNPLGNLIPLSRVARIERASGLSKYEHEQNRRQIKVTADVDLNVSSALQANSRARDFMGEILAKHPGVSVTYGGEDEDTNESLAGLLRAFVLAVMGIFLILIMTFKNILQPLLVLITVPLAVVSAIWAFFLHGLPLSFMGCLGIIALVGVIVNNAIVLVDFVNQARAAGSGKMESIVEAAKTRVRPIFLTTITTVIGVLPTAYGIGGLDAFVVPLAMSLGWGLAFGAVLTAFVFPAALALLDDFESFWAGLKSKLRKRPAAA
jgi:multidrug efflux pump subunit AcrB